MYTVIFVYQITFQLVCNTILKSKRYLYITYANKCVKNHYSKWKNFLESQRLFFVNNNMSKYDLQKNNHYVSI